MGATDLLMKAYTSLGSRINKLVNKDGEETNQGVVSDKMPELTLQTPSEDIITITKKWEKEWNESPVKARFDKDGTENENYWLGKHFQKAKADTSRAMVDNALFEALETYLPQVTRQNPEPMVILKGEENKANQENQTWAKRLQTKLAEVADDTVMRIKLKRQARHWAIYLIGMIKMGWDLNTNLPKIDVIRPKKLILDPDSTVNEEGYTGRFMGEYREMEAGTMLNIIEKVGEPDATKLIEELVEKEKGTQIRFIEWWTREATYWTLDDKVLLKKKNIHWNWTKEEEQMAGEQPLYDEDTGDPIIDEETGLQKTMPIIKKIQIPGINHLPKPDMPYIALSVFNLGKSPIDDTSLMGQNLANQDVINKRNKQIDKNIDSMNGGIAVSLERSGLTANNAAGVAKAVQKGGVIAIPTGAVGDAIVKLSSPGLPADVYNNLQDVRNRLKDLFGTRGSSAAGLDSTQTVRGKIMNRTLDSDRIGGGFSEYLEQVADKIYNWCVQLMYVYDEEYANGQPKPAIKVTVKEGSLLPKDSTTIANQAIELAGAGKMSVLDLYKKLDYPNPEELAANVWLEANAPDVLFGNDPRVQQVLQMKAQQAQQATTQENEKPVSKSISFKDLPPDGQAQLAAQAGIDLHPEAIAAHNEFKNEVQNQNKIPINPVPSNGV